MNQTITEHKAISVKNAKLFYDHERMAFRLIHYSTEILTVKCRLVAGNKEDTKIIQINPVSDSSKNAIQEGLYYIFGEHKNIDAICRELNTNRNKLSEDFWGFDAFKRYPYHQRPMEEWRNRPSTFNEVTWSLKRFTKSDWNEISERLAETELPEQKELTN